MRSATLIAAAWLAGVGLANAETAPLEVVYDEYGAVAVSLSGVVGDPEAGRKVFSTKSQGNCVSCHAVTELAEDVPFHGEVGPILDGVGSRWNISEMRGIVANAKITYEGTVMPSFYKTTGYIRPGDAYTGKAAKSEFLAPLLTAQQIEDVVAYLMTLTEE